MNTNQGGGREAPLQVLETLFQVDTPVHFFSDGQASRLSIRQCHERIQALSGFIERRFPATRHVALIFRTEPLLVIAWMAVVRSGRSPLVLQYPNEKQHYRSWRESVSHTLASAQVDLLLTGETIGELADWTVPLLQIPDTWEECSTDLLRVALPVDPPASVEPRPSCPNCALGTCGFLQLSSGTTGFRKAISYRFQDLMAHVEAYQATLSLSHQDCIVSWLPLYHDMGFIACFLLPLIKGIPLVLIDPIRWVRDPGTLWQAIHAFQGTLCFMPNFGFELMARNAPVEPPSSMRLWISCSEPTYESTVQHFMQATGARPSQVGVCYAAAENIFAITQRVGFRMLTLPQGNYPSCGTVIPGTSVKVVDGEILIRSPYSAKEYLNAHLPMDDEGFYHSGDLGTLVGGELAVLGRLHDVAVIAGTKVILNDLDAALNELCPKSAGRCAALADLDKAMGTQKLICLIEDLGGLAEPSQAGAVQRGLRERSGLETPEIHFVPPRFISKSSSGKISRNKTLSDFKAAQEWKATWAGPRTSSPIAEILSTFQSVELEKPPSEQFDSLGLVVLALILENWGLTLDAQRNLSQQIGPPPSEPGTAGSPEGCHIVVLGDARAFSWLREEDLEAWSSALGAPVTLEHICTPPSPVLLSDLTFMEWFAPRNARADLEPLVDIFARIRSASLLVVDDLTELWFPHDQGQDYPVLNHRGFRDPEADLLCYRWQRYTSNHNLLPLEFIAGRDLPMDPDASLRSLERRLGIPIFRMAFLSRHAELTSEWEFIQRSCVDGELPTDPRALKETLETWLQDNRHRVPLKPRPARESIKLVDLPHFCCWRLDSEKLDATLEAYGSFCLLGTRSSASYIGKRLASLGKPYFHHNTLDLGGLDEETHPFECVLQLGSWGQPKTSKPVIQVFVAGWGVEDYHYKKW